ncbi:MAG: ATP-binding protein [Burkholderiales bacterium]
MSIDDAILAEQARYIHRTLPTGVIGGFVVVLVAASTFLPVVELAWLVMWVAAHLLVAAFRLAAWQAYRGSAFGLADAKRWLQLAIVGAAISGATWGAGALFLYPPGQVAFQLVYLFAVMMMSAGALFSFGVHVPTFLAFFLASGIPATLGLVAQGTPLHWELAAAITIFMFVVLRFVRAFSASFRRTQELRFENEALVGELTRQRNAAEAANQAKSRFLAAASHDLRQPMHALSLYLGGLSGLALPAAARATLDNVARCADTMDTMFRALLDVSRLDAGAVQPEPQAFALAPLLERLRLEFEPQAHAKGLRLRVAPCSAAVFADPALVERIIRNLLSNAVRYTNRGRILVGCRRRAGSLRLEVLDTGVGIAPEHQRQVFEEFYQASNPERDRAKGIGLGLAIVERLARLMGTSVELASLPGRGSRFLLELPRATLAAPAALARPEAPQAARHGFAGSLVAVIDDEESILRATRELLEQWECRVVTAASGRAAIEQLSMSPRAPDAIVCDYRLRGEESGVAAIEALRAEFNEDIPALLITGDTGPERLRELEASGLRVLHKPVQGPALRDALRRLLGVQAAA